MKNALVRIAESLLYAAFWCAGLVVHLIPFPVRDAMARALALLWFYVVRFRRRIILLNLSVVFPRLPEEAMGAFQVRCERLAIENLRHVVHSFLEILERFQWTQRVFEERIEVEGNEHIQRALAGGRGFLFLTAHLGNWELITIVGKMLGVPLAIITRKLRNGFFDRIWVRSRERYGLELLEEYGSGLAVVRGVRRGKAIGFIMDQHTGEPHGIETEFLGVRAWCPKGLAILSERLKCPILPAYMLRKEDGRFHLHIGAPLEFPRLRANEPGLRTESGALTEEGLRYHVGLCNENMRNWIFREPGQYLWMHRRFKNILDYSAPLPWEL